MKNEMLIQKLHNDGLDEVGALIESQAAKIVKLKKSDDKWLNLVVKLGENAVEMESHIAELEKEVSIARRCVFNLDCNIKELEKEKGILRVICEEADGIACDCTITDSQAVERLLDLFDKSRDVYMPLKEQGK
jgi:hypothetical protein